jgi:predicted HicB family RNase H-like nuclease
MVVTRPTAHQEDHAMKRPSTGNQPFCGLSIRVRPEVYEALRREARSRDASLNSLICEAIEGYCAALAARQEKKAEAE